MHGRSRRNWGVVGQSFRISRPRPLLSEVVSFRQGWRRAIVWWVLGTIIGWGLIAAALAAFYALMVQLGWWENATLWVVQMIYFAVDHYACPRL